MKEKILSFTDFRYTISYEKKFSECGTTYKQTITLYVTKEKLNELNSIVFPLSYEKNLAQVIDLFPNKCKVGKSCSIYISSLKEGMNYTTLSMRNLIAFICGIWYDKRYLDENTCINVKVVNKPIKNSQKDIKMFLLLKDNIKDILPIHTSTSYKENIISCADKIITCDTKYLFALSFNAICNNKILDIPIIFVKEIYTNASKETLSSLILKRYAENGWNTNTMILFPLTDRVKPLSNMKDI